MISQKPRLRSALAAAWFLSIACLLAAAAPGHAGDETAGALSADDQASLATIRQQAPTIAATIEHAPDIRAELGPEAFSKALAEVAWVCKSHDRDCLDALRIIGDTVTRVITGIRQVVVDGSPDEWSQTMPPPDSVRHHDVCPDHAETFWARGAAVVRNDRLYLMAGIADRDYFQREDAELHVYVDCVGGPQWDTRLALTRHAGVWRLVANFWPKDGKPACEPVEIADLQVATDDVVECNCDATSFAPPAASKPVWTVAMCARSHVGPGEVWPWTWGFAVLNETAEPGVAAPTYVRNLMFLAADRGLHTQTRTALAIVITSAFLCEIGKADVLPAVRQDNAEFLDLAHEISRWQTRIRANYSLALYPLEAQLAWSHRLAQTFWYGVNNRDPNANLPDAECYRWGVVGAGTLRDLRATLIDRQLVSPVTAETAGLIDQWASDVERGGDKDADDPIFGTLHGNPIHLADAATPAAFLTAVLTRGRYFGVCGQQCRFVMSLLRAAGIATHIWGIAPLKEGCSDHVWACYYDPATGRWRSYQGRQDDDLPWIFRACGPVPVYSYAAMAPYLDGEHALGPTPFPYFFRMEVKGREIGAMTQEGIPTATIREWMLTPCFSG